MAALPTEVLLAIVTIAGTFIGALGYVIKKWAETKEKQFANEAELAQKRLDHEIKMEEKRDTRDDLRARQLSRTNEFIASNTGLMSAMRKQLEEQTIAIRKQTEVFQNEISNGLSSSVRDNSQRLSELEEGSRERLANMKEVVTAIVENLEKHTGDSNRNRKEIREDLARIEELIRKMDH